MTHDWDLVEHVLLEDGGRGHEERHSASGPNAPKCERRRHAPHGLARMQKTISLHFFGHLRTGGAHGHEGCRGRSRCLKLDAGGHLLREGVVITFENGVCVGGRGSGVCEWASRPLASSSAT